MIPSILSFRSGVATYQVSTCVAFFRFAIGSQQDEIADCSRETHWDRYRILLLFTFPFLLLLLFVCLLLPSSCVMWMIGIPLFLLWCSSLGLLFAGRLESIHVDQLFSSFRRIMMPGVQGWRQGEDDVAEWRIERYRGIRLQGEKQKVCVRWGTIGEEGETEGEDEARRWRLKLFANVVLQILWMKSGEFQGGRMVKPRWRRVNSQWEKDPNPQWKKVRSIYRLL